VSRLLWLDYRAGLRERKVWFAVAVFAYAILSLPLLLANPPPHVRDAMDAWFGARDPFTLFMFMWTDLAMNKLIATLAVVLAGGVVLRERDTGVLPLLAAKPLSLPTYFTVRTISACGVMASVYLGAQLVGALYFSAMVEGFRVLPFLAAASLHVWAAIFATALAATLLVVVGRRGLGLLAGLLALLTLVGLAFIGFYNPAWATVSLINPISLGVQSLAHLDAIIPGVLLPPMLALMVISAVTIAGGAWAVRNMEA
jgi:ABC-2 type transport system permease protein